MIAECEARGCSNTFEVRQRSGGKPHRFCSYRCRDKSRDRRTPQERRRNRQRRLTDESYREAVRRGVHRYNALKHKAAGHSTPEAYQARFDFYGGRCAYCRAELETVWHWDHVIPLSKGGSNWPANLRPACPSCNLSKHDSDLAEWIARVGEGLRCE